MRGRFRRCRVSPAPVFAHRSRHEIARLWDLAVVAQKQPATSEYSLQLGFVNLGLDKDPAADHSVVSIHKSFELHSS
jgi:hypothetical protein